MTWYITLKRANNLNKSVRYGFTTCPNQELHDIGTRFDQGALHQRRHGERLGQQKNRAEARFHRFAAFTRAAGRSGLALARLEPGVRLVDDVDAPFAPNNTAVLVAVLHRFKRTYDFHGSNPSVFLLIRYEARKIGMVASRINKSSKNDIPEPVS